MKMRGWRLLICLSLWLAACNARPYSTSLITPTDYPPVTLTVFHDPSKTPDIVDTAHHVTLVPPLPPLILSSPICKEQPENQLVCLGIVDNFSDEAVAQVILKAQFLDEQQQIIETQLVPIEQQIIPPGASAPYRIIFTGSETNFSGVTVTLHHASETNDSRIKIEIRDRVIAPSNTAPYIISTTLHNLGEDDAGVVRVIVTLYDDKGEIVGYRTQTLDHLSANTRQMMQFRLISPVADRNFTHTVHVEAWSAS